MTVAALCLMLFTVALVYLPGIYEYAMLPKWLAFHVCLALGCAGWWVRTGWGGDAGFISSPPNVPAVCFLAAGLVSAHATTHPIDTLVELVNVTSLIILFFLAANVLTPKGLLPVLWTSAVAGLIVSLIGILQYHQLAFTGIPSNALPSATFANRNLAAEYLICVIPLSGLLYLFVRSWEASIISGLAGTLMAVNLVYTRTRGAWVSVVAALIIIGAVLILCRGFRAPFFEAVRSGMDRRKRFLSLGFLIVFVILSALPPHRSPRSVPEVKTGIASTALSVFKKEELKDASITERLAFWGSTLRMISDHPLFGVGPGGWIRKHPLYDGGRTITTEGYHRKPHNDYLWIGAEYGLIGLGIYIWFLLAGFRCLLKMGLSRDRFHQLAAPMFALSILSILGAACFGFPKEQAQTALFPFFLFGIAAGATAESRILPGRSVIRGSILCALFFISVGAAEISRRRIGFDRHYLGAFSWGVSEKGWPDVLSEVKRANRYGSFRSDLVFFKGLALQNLERYTEAEEAYRQTLTVAPHTWYAHEGLGFVYLKQGRFRDALVHCQTALNLCPSANYIRDYIGAIYLQMGKPELAEQEFRAALQVSPHNAEMRYNMGKLYEAKGQLDSAIVHYQEAIRLNPDQPMTHADLAFVYLLQGRPDEALLHYRDAVRIYPEDANVQQGFGLSLKGVGQLQEAEKAFKEAIRLRPGFIQGHLALGNIAFEQGRFREAQASYRTLLELSEDDTTRARFVRERIAECEDQIQRGGMR